MGVVLKHPSREMSGHRLDDMLRFAGLEQVRHHGVAQVMKSEAA